MAKAKGNPNPVIPPNFGKTFTPEERRRNSAKGGLNKGKNYRERKRAEDILNAFLEMPLKKRQKLAELSDIEAYEALKNKNITVNEAIQLKQVQKALNGDLASATYIRDTIGEKPTQKVEAKVEQSNPFEGLTTEELRKLVGSDD